MTHSPSEVSPSDFWKLATWLETIPAGESANHTFSELTKTQRNDYLMLALDCLDCIDPAKPESGTLLHVIGEMLDYEYARDPKNLLVHTLFMAAHHDRNDALRLVPNAFRTYLARYETVYGEAEADTLIGEAFLEHGPKQGRDAQKSVKHFNAVMQERLARGKSAGVAFDFYARLAKHGAEDDPRQLRRAMKHLRAIMPDLSNRATAPVDVDRVMNGLMGLVVVRPALERVAQKDDLESLDGALDTFWQRYFDSHQADEKPALALYKKAALARLTAVPGDSLKELMLDLDVRLFQEGAYEPAARVMWNLVQATSGMPKQMGLVRMLEIILDHAPDANGFHEFCMEIAPHFANYDNMTKITGPEKPVFLRGATKAVPPTLRGTLDKLLFRLERHAEDQQVENPLQSADAYLALAQCFEKGTFPHTDFRDRMLKTLCDAGGRTDRVGMADFVQNRISSPRTMPDIKEALADFFDRAMHDQPLRGQEKLSAVLKKMAGLEA